VSKKVLLLLKLSWNGSCNIVFPSLLWHISKWNGFSDKKKCWAVLFLSNYTWLDGCGLLLVDLMWVTGCTTLVPVNASSEKKRDVIARGKGSYFDKGHMRKKKLKCTDKSFIINIAIRIVILISWWLTKIENKTNYFGN